MTPGCARVRGMVFGLACMLVAACGSPEGLPCEEPDGASAELDRVPLRVGGEDVSAEVAATAEERRSAWAGRRCDLDALLWVPDAVGPVGVELCEVEVAVDLAFLYEGEVVAVERELPPCDAPCDACPIYGGGRDGAGNDAGEGDPAVDAVLWLSAGRVDVAAGDSVTGLDAVVLPTS